MENIKKNPLYESTSEKELIKMWEDINGKNIESLNRSLLKEIAKHTEEPAIDKEKDIIYAKEMWDSKIGEWVPFDLWGAHFIVNDRKEYLVLRIYRPLTIQPEYGPILKGWQSIDSSYLNEQLRENKRHSDQFNKFKSFSGFQAFYEMIKQDHQEHNSDGRYSENKRRI